MTLPLPSSQIRLLSGSTLSFNDAVDEAILESISLPLSTAISVGSVQSPSSSSTIGYSNALFESKDMQLSDSTFSTSFKLANKDGKVVVVVLLEVS